MRLLSFLFKQRSAAALPVLAGLLLLSSCGGYRQTMDLSPESMRTPSHSMSRGDYPFDAEGNYRDSWAAAGSGRFPGARNSFTSDDSDLPPVRATLPPEPRRVVVVQQPPPEPPPPPSPVRMAPQPAESFAPPPPVVESQPVTQPQRPTPVETVSRSRPVPETAKRAPVPSKPAPKVATKTPAKPKTPGKVATKRAARHTIKAGDTLSSLSRRYGVSIAAIKKANAMKSDLLINGKSVTIPK